MLGKGGVRGWCVLCGTCAGSCGLDPNPNPNRGELWPRREKAVCVCSELFVTQVVSLSRRIEMFTKKRLDMKKAMRQLLLNIRRIKEFANAQERKGYLNHVSLL